MIGGELGTETINSIGFFVGLSAICVSTNFRLDREGRFYYELC